MISDQFDHLKVSGLHVLVVKLWKKMAKTESFGNFSLDRGVWVPYPEKMMSE